MKKLCVFMLLCLTMLMAQEIDYEGLQHQGKQLYQQGLSEEALDVYQTILNAYPNDVDALLFRGRILAQLGLYDLAEAELLHTLELAPEYLDVYYALASVYYWDEQLDKANKILTEWIARDLQNPEAYLLSARVAIADRHYAAARTLLEQARDFGADPAMVETLFSTLQTPKTGKKWETGIGYEYLAVDQGRPDWQQGKAFILHDFGKLVAIAEVDRYRRNDANDHTVVLDTYYELWKKAYMNTRIQAGLNWVFMPRMDITAEVFQGVGTRHEAALGYRIMYYGDITAHIPSIAWAIYPGKWYLREKVSMIMNETTSWQNQLTVRYFLGDVDSYLQLMNVLGTDFNVIDGVWAQSISFALSGSWSLTDHWVLTGVASWTRDEFNLNRLGGSAGFLYLW